MKKLIAAAALAVTIPFASANAQENDAERAAALQACLLENSGLPEDALFRNLLKSMIDNDVDMTRSFIFSILGRMEEIAITQCGAPDDITEQAWAAEIPGEYMQQMIVELFSDLVTALGEI